MANVRGGEVGRLHQVVVEDIVPGHGSVLTLVEPSCGPSGLGVVKITPYINRYPLSGLSLFIFLIVLRHFVYHYDASRSAT